MKARLYHHCAAMTLAATTSSCGAGPPAEPTSPTAAAVGAATPDEPEPEPSAGPPSTAKARCAAACTGWIDAARTHLERAEAAGEAPNVEVLYRQAGDGWAKAWRGCDLYRETGADLSCEGADTVVEAMIAAYDRAGDDGGAIFARLVALDPRWTDPASDLAARSRTELGQRAELAEAHSRSAPKAVGAAGSLAAAVYARLKLEEPTAATADARRFRQRYGRTDRSEAALLGIAIAAYHGNRGEWREALAALGPPTTPAGLEERSVRVLWHARRGQALAALGRKREASRELNRVLELWTPLSPDATATAVGRAKPAPMQGREQVVDAVGTAHFLLAEQLRERAAELAMPPYRGPATVEGVNRHVQTQVVEWAKKRNAVVLEAAERYRQIDRIQPVPPPRWIVAAAAATGAMWAELATAFTEASLPAPVAADAELRQAWRQAMQEASTPALDAARRAYRRCVRAAGQRPVSGAPAAPCEQWLRAHR